MLIIESILLKSKSLGCFVYEIREKKLRCRVIDLFNRNLFLKINGLPFLFLSPSEI